MAVPEPRRGVDGRDTLLSVIVPTHQVVPWIDDLLTSILSSRIVGMEVIVVDDHSTDGTRERVADHASVDPRVRMIFAHDRGGAHARNLGLQAARGTFVAFADGDDIVPPGAYERLVTSLERSGSDIAFGDWLKFSSIRTWQPSHNWHVFDEDAIGSRLSELPQLIRGRAVWNKVFRRAFLEQIGLRFPEAPRSNDIVPMTRAYLASRQIDVIADCVYLYRDRPGSTSMSSRAGAVTASKSYLEQEAACARLIADRGDARLSATYSALIFDADAWLHLSRFLRGVSDPAAVDRSVVDAARALAESTPQSALRSATPHKCVLWSLLVAGEVELAHRFNAAEESAREAGVYDLATMLVWVEAVSAMLSSPVLPDVDRRRIAVDGMVAIVLHHAVRLTAEERGLLVERVAESRILDSVDLAAVRQLPLASMVDALRRRDQGSVAVISTYRDRQLVVDDVAHQRGFARLGGAWDREEQPVSMRLVAVKQSDGRRRSVEIAREAGRWTASVAAGALSSGRWDLLVEYGDGTSAVEQPVVTARMVLPALMRDDRVQVMSDRRRGWRVVFEVRPPALLRAVRRILRRSRRLLHS